LNCEVSPELLLGTALIGAAIGLLSGAFGKGGSALATPLLHAIGVPAIVAVASPLPATIPATLVASRTYAEQRTIDGRVMRIAILFGVPATIAGALCTRWIPGAALVLVTDAMVAFFGVRMLLRAHHAGDEEDATLATDTSVVRIGAIALMVGGISGLLGNSGGFLLAPLFVTALHMPLRRALGTSLAVSAALAIPGTIVHASLGHIDWAVTLAFAATSVPFARAGARLAFRVKARSLSLAYGFGITSMAGSLLLFAR
jgi:uncharacterized membrane protein YfcA